MKCPFLIAIAVVSCCGSLNSAENLAEEDHEDRLMRVMMSQSKFRRPVLSSKDNVTVQFGITLHQIIDVVEKNQILKLSLFTRQKWSNPLLRWNLSDYGGVSEINVDPDYLWKPDIYLYNNADEDKDGAQDRARTNIQVDHNGTNKWFAPVITQSSCKINVQYFPFDEQSCTLKFGSWTYDAWRVDIVAEGESADLNTFQVNGEWSLVSFPCKGNKEVYKCCPQPYSDVTCTLKIRRRTTYFFVNLIVPCFLITVLSLLSFFLPSEAGERITLVITNLLALTVFMLIVADILPPTSEVVPLISIYFTSILIEVGLSLIATCIVLKCYFTNPTTTEVPFWVHCLVFRGISKLIGMKVEKKGRKSRRSKKAADDDKTSHLPVSMAESLPSNFNVNSHVTSHRAVDTDGLLSEHSNDPFCKVCYDKNVNLLHVPKELNSRNSSRSPSRTSLKRDSWCESAPNENNFNFNLHSQKCLIAALLHQQEHLVNNVNRLVKALEKQEKLEEKREEWFMVAEILDTFFLYVFVIIMIGSTVLIFAVKNLG